MPILFFFFIVLLIIAFWDYINANVAIIGSIATTLAFFATAWAALEARSSAKAALKAVKLTSDSLFEMRKASFKQWLGLLLEKNDEMVKELSILLHADNELNNKLLTNHVQRAYYAVVKRPEIKKYINHVIIILKYIDKEFYVFTESKESRVQYVEQLRNSIDPKVKLIISIFALNVSKDSIYKSRELSFLLNKYDFFEDELLFEDVINNAIVLESFLNDQFDKHFKVSLMHAAKHRIVNYESKAIESYDGLDFDYQPNLLFSVLCSYKNPCKGILLKRFDLVGGYIKNEIEIMIANAPKMKLQAEDELCKLIGYRLVSTNKLKHRSGKYIINNKKDILKLVDRLISNSKNEKQNIDLGDVYFTKDGCDDVMGFSYEKIVERYDLSCSLISIVNGNRKDSLFSEISFMVGEIVEHYKDKLNKISYH